MDYSLKKGNPTLISSSKILSQYNKVILSIWFLFLLKVAIYLNFTY